MYVPTSTPFVRRTRAILRSAEFGFLGVVVETRVQTPRFCGAPASAGVLTFAFFLARPLRTSWLTVGMLRLSFSFWSYADRRAAEHAAHAEPAGHGTETAPLLQREKRRPGGQIDRRRLRKLVFAAGEAAEGLVLAPARPDGERRFPLLGEQRSPGRRGCLDVGEGAERRRLADLDGARRYRLAR